MNGIAVKGAESLGWTGGEAPAEFTGFLPNQAASGAGVTCYAGIVGRAARTLVLNAGQWITAAGTVNISLARGITGQAAIGQALGCINASGIAPSAQCISGADASVLGGVIKPLQAFDPGSVFNPGVGSFFQLYQFIGGGGTTVTQHLPNFPIYLFPGDAIIGLSTRATTAAAFRFLVTIAEYAA